MPHRAPLGTLGRALVVLFCVLIALNLAALVSSFMQLDLLEQFAAGDIDPAAADANDTREAVIAVSYLVVFIVTVVVFLVWFHRAYRNLEAFGVITESSTGWAVWGFIIPIISLFKPYQIMRETFHASSPTPDDKQGLVGAWWALFLISGLIGQIAFRLGRDADSISELVDVTHVTVLSDLVDIPSAILALMVVRTLSDWQDERGHGARQLARVFD